MGTEAPTTEAPTTQAVTTTEAPTTEASTTEALTTEVPTTVAPSTEAPTSGVPATSPCAYSEEWMAVLDRPDYRSDTLYLEACAANCNANSRCTGFTEAGVNGRVIPGCVWWKCRQCTLSYLAAPANPLQCTPLRSTPSNTEGWY